MSNDPRKRQTLYLIAVSSWSETFAFAALGIVAMATVGVAIVWGWMPAGDMNEAQLAPQQLPAERHFTPGDREFIRAPTSKSSQD